MTDREFVFKKIDRLILREWACLLTREKSTRTSNTASGRITGLRLSPNNQFEHNRKRRQRQRRHVLLSLSIRSQFVITSLAIH